mgnify:CR=1 FL=1
MTYLVVDHVELVALPLLADLFEERFERHLSLSHHDYFAKNSFVFLQVRVPDLTERQIIQHPVDTKVADQLLPMAEERDKATQTVEDDN